MMTNEESKIQKPIRKKAEPDGKQEGKEIKTGYRKMIVYGEGFGSE